MSSPCQMSCAAKDGKYRCETATDCSNGIKEGYSPRNSFNALPVILVIVSIIVLLFILIKLLKR